MKRLHKLLMGAGITLCLGAGITSAIITAQTKEQLSDLTLANIEAIAQGEGTKVNGPGERAYCSACMTYHTYCKGRNDKSCLHTGH